MNSLIPVSRAIIIIKTTHHTINFSTSFLTFWLESTNDDDDDHHGDNKIT